MPLKKGPNHNQSGRTEYTVWERMRSRCNNPNDKRYAQYGGRGIGVCSSWDDFTVFLRDMGERPKGTSLDRINNEHGYSFTNCRWATQEEQSNNTQRPLPIGYLGETKTLKQWATKLNLPYASLWYRYSKGVRLPELFQPIAKTGNKPIRRSV